MNTSTSNELGAILALEESNRAVSFEETAGGGSQPTPRFDEATQTLPRPSESTAMPRQFGRYRVLQLLGKGAFAAVWLAADDELQRQVAIKVGHAKREASSEDIAAYLMEARALAALDHPHIVPV